MSLTNTNKPVVESQIKKDEYYIKKLEDKIKYLEAGIQELSKILNPPIMSGIQRRVDQSRAIIEVLKKQIKI